MEIIHLIHPYLPHRLGKQPFVLALGFFDGVHKGHQAVINEARKEAERLGLPLALMTFNQHPKIVYQNLDPNQIQYLTLIDRKIELLQALGVDRLYLVDYSLAFGSQSPETFVNRYIVDLGAHTVVAGFDYTYGKPEIANMQTLPIHARGRFQVIEVAKECIESTKIGSTSIRQLIENEKIDLANLELGYPYQTRGIVVHGDKRGRTIGYPTANIQVHPQEVLPSVGVYVVEIFVEGIWYKGMASIGYNITFEANRKKTCEVYIIDFEADIYDKIVLIRWHHYLRGEIKFDGIQGLVKQLDQDLVDTLDYFEGQKNG